MSTLFDSNNRLLLPARRSQRLPHPLLAFVLPLVFIIAGAGIGLIIFLAIMAPLSLMQDSGIGALVEGAIISNFELSATFVPALLVLWLWMRRYEGRSLSTLGLERRGAAIKFARGAFVGFVMVAAMVGISYWAQFVAVDVETPGMEGRVAVAGVVFTFIGWFAQSSTEEIIFRGWQLPVLGARYRPAVAVAISSFAFMALHLFNGAFVPIAIINWLLMGLFFSLYALWDESVWGVCAVHAVWNWATSHVFSLEPGVPLGGTLVNLHDPQLNTIFGGSFGPDFMFVQAAILLVGVAIMLTVARWNAPVVAPVRVPAEEVA